MNEEKQNASVIKILEIMKGLTFKEARELIQKALRAIQDKALDGKITD